MNRKGTPDNTPFYNQTARLQKHNAISGVISELLRPRKTFVALLCLVILHLVSFSNPIGLNVILDVCEPLQALSPANGKSRNLEVRNALSIGPPSTSGGASVPRNR